MKDTISLILRGIIFGGAFGAKIGALISFRSSDPWTWISTMLFIGILVGLASCIGIALSSQLEKGTRNRKSMMAINSSEEKRVLLVK